MATEAETLRAIFVTNRSLAEWSAIAVFAGLVGDIAVIFAFSKDKPRSEIVLSVICTFIIALGVYGEYTFGSRAGHAADRLQEIADKDLESAKLRVAKAEQDNLQLRKELEKETAVSRLRQTELEREQQKTALAQEKAARAQLELNKFLANRLFESPPHERFRILTGLPKARVEVWYMKYDGRAYTFAVGVVQSLKELKWDVIGPIPVERTPDASFIGQRSATLF